MGGITMTKTKSFGTGNKEGHDSSEFNNRKMIQESINEDTTTYTNNTQFGWENKIYCPVNIGHIKHILYDFI